MLGWAAGLGHGLARGLRAGSVARRSAPRAASALRAMVTMPDAGKKAVLGRRRFAYTNGNDDTELGEPIPVQTVGKESYDAWIAQQNTATVAWLQAANFSPENAGAVLLVPAIGQHGTVDGMHKVVLALGDESDADSWWHIASLPAALPPKNKYYLDKDSLPGSIALHRAYLAWWLGTYRFGVYKSPPPKPLPKMVMDDQQALDESSRLARAIFLARDLVNVPAEDMGPKDLADAAEALAEEHGASVSVLVGEQLLEQNFPQVYAVGKAARLPDESRSPRVVDLKWGDDPSLPELVLVGKGVCYDTGGLDIKPAAAMRNMKKDMAGAALMLALADLVISAGLKCRLRVILAAVENNIAGDAFRPGDILRARNGKTTEIDNTDAEGRLILADCLALACEDQPDLIIDAATLTGAQRVAHGIDIMGIFSTSNESLFELQTLGEEVGDPVWSLPLHKPYRKQLDSSVADMKNCGAGGYGGAITAALYLQEFVKSETPWIHCDFMGFNTSSRPGRPEGGESQGLRTLFEYLARKYA